MLGRDGAGRARPGWAESSRRLALMVGLGASACAPRAVAPTHPTHDSPAPPGEASALLSVELDLPPARDCEERFDLALYEERGVEQVAWSEDPMPCSARHAAIRYFPRRVSREELLGRVGRLATKVREVTPHPVAAGARGAGGNGGQ